MLIGVTGFIGKVWLAQMLMQIPEIGRIYLLIRKQRSTTSARRFEKIVQESPVFEPLNKQYGDDFANFLPSASRSWKAISSAPIWASIPTLANNFRTQLDLVVNSSRPHRFQSRFARRAFEGNVAAPMNAAGICARLANTPRCCIFPLATSSANAMAACAKSVQPNYTPACVADFNAEHEWKSLQETIRNVEARAECPEMTAALRRQALGRRSDPSKYPADGSG